MATASRACETSASEARRGSAGWGGRHLFWTWRCVARARRLDRCTPVAALRGACRAEAACCRAPSSAHCGRQMHAIRKRRGIGHNISGASRMSVVRPDRAAAVREKVERARAHSTVEVLAKRCPGAEKWSRRTERSTRGRRGGGGLLTEDTSTAWGGARGRQRAADLLCKLRLGRKTAW